MTLRQLWIRIDALPPDAPLWMKVRERQAEVEATMQVDDIDATLALIAPNKGDET